MAYPFDEEADDTQTPDLQASAGLSYGGTTPQLMEMLQRMGPSPSQQAGQALAGGVAFARGQANPVTPIINQQMVQQNAIMNMLSNLNSQQQANARHQKTLEFNQAKLRQDDQAKRDAIQLQTRIQDRLDDKERLTILNELKDNPEPLAQEAWALGVSRISERLGQKIAPEFFKQQMKIPAEERDNIRIAIEGGATDEQIASLYPKAAQNPEYLTIERNILKTPALRAKLDYPTNEKLQELEWDHAKKKIENWASENGFKTDSPEFLATNRAFRKLSGGKNIYDTDPSNVQELLLVEQARKQGVVDAVKDMEVKKEMEMGYERQMADYNHRLAMARDQVKEGIADRKAGRKPLPGTWVDMKTGFLVTPSQEEYELNGGSQRYRNPSSAEETLLSRLATAEPMAKQIYKLIDGLLVDTTPENLTNALKGKVSQKLRNHPGWSQLNTLLTEQNIELTGALGPGQFRTTLMTYLQDAGIQTKDTREVARIVQDTIETSIHNRRMSIISGGNQAKMREYQNPLAPKKPAMGWKLVDGNWISTSGKKMWKDGKEVDIP